ncbi:hypothetical protein ACFPOG_30670 [Paenibacillus aestuarii]|uniref:N-acetyltransferase domain-containing protein n=1 Tax=Paenibacillus aestuarii TaxID=516965 RepID=A0ABW0KIX1_9BACL
MIKSKPMKDRSGKLVRTRYELNWIESSNHDGIQKIEILNDKEEEVGFLEFFLEEADLEIFEFKVKTQRLGHGTLLMHTLFKLVPRFNDRLLAMGLKKITAIKGTVVPDETIISKEVLTKMYEGYGFKVEEDDKFNISLEEVVKLQKTLFLR